MKLLKVTPISAMLLMAMEVIGPAQETGTSWMLAKRTTFVINFTEKERLSLNMSGALPGVQVSGRAEVRRLNGLTEVKLTLAHLRHPQELGANFTSYVIWAISPEGVADNIGRLSVSKDGTAEIELTTSPPPFGLIVTAEPHPLVMYPGPLIVAENRLDEDNKQPATQRIVGYYGDPGIYYIATDRSYLSGSPDYSTPLMVLGARRAVEIARRGGAEQHSKAQLQRATSRLAVLEQLWSQNLTNGSADQGKDDDIQNVALDVMRLAEAARAAAVDPFARARAFAKTIIAQSTAVEIARANRARYEIELAQALNRAEQALTRTERIEARERIVELETQRAQWENRQPRSQREETIRKLQNSVSEILETRRDQRGLIISLPDSSFNPNQATLAAKAKTGLNRLLLQLLATSDNYPLKIEGYIDSANSDAFNRKLSEERVVSVRNYLVEAGLLANQVTSVGMVRKADSSPAADTRPFKGRVEIVILEAATQSSSQ